MNQFAKVATVATIFGLGMNVAIADMPKVLNIAYLNNSPLKREGFL